MQIHCQESLLIVYSLRRYNERKKRVLLSYNWWVIINPGFQELQPYTIRLPISLHLLSLSQGFLLPTRCCCWLLLSGFGCLNSSLFFQTTPALSVVAIPKGTKGSQKNTRIGPDKNQQGSIVDSCRA